MKQNIQIWGAGIAGLIAANIFQTAHVFEKGQRTEGGHHKALLRFRSAAVGEACGIDFRCVRVHKGLWDGGYVQPNILHANDYSRKVIGRLADRSVWSLEPVDRWVAPPDFVDQLIDRVNSRISWNTDGMKGQIIDGVMHPINNSVVISTIPMNVLAEAFGDDTAPEFKRAGITVRRWIIPDADVYQTVYVSDPTTTCYRVSITGNLLIAEFIGGCSGQMTFDPGEPFGVRLSELEELPSVQQSYGKIQPIDDAWRKKFIFNLSHHSGIFSLGRFGTWRNILLDDVLHDCAVIKRMIAQDAYGRSQEMWK